jgi:hypothetical protein
VLAYELLATVPDVEETKPTRLFNGTVMDIINAIHNEPWEICVFEASVARYLGQWFNLENLQAALQKGLAQRENRYATARDLVDSIKETYSQPETISEPTH